MAGGDKSLIYPTMRAVVGALAIDGEIYVVGFDNEDIIGFPSRIACGGYGQMSELELCRYLQVSQLSLSISW